MGFEPASPKPSILVYKKKTHYNEWEFVYDPVAEQMMMQGGANQGSNGLTNGTNGTGTGGTGTGGFGTINNGGGFGGSTIGGGSPGGTGFGTGTGTGSGGTTTPTQPQQ